jgi:hypothetical protein
MNLCLESQKPGGRGLSARMSGNAGGAAEARFAMPHAVSKAAHISKLVLGDILIDRSSTAAGLRTRLQS